MSSSIVDEEVMKWQWQRQTYSQGGGEGGG